MFWAYLGFRVYVALSLEGFTGFKAGMRIPGSPKAESPEALVLLICSGSCLFCEIEIWGLQVGGMKCFGNDRGLNIYRYEFGGSLL